MPGPIENPNPVPSQLKQVGTNRIYPFSEALWQRGDMRPHDPNQPVVTGLLDREDLEERSKHENMEPVEIQYNETNLVVAFSSAAAVKALIDRVAMLEAENSKMKIALSGSPSPGPGPVDDTQTESPEGPRDDNRMYTMVQGIKTLKAAGDQNSFTAQGLPTIPALEEVCGFTMDATERNQAYEAWLSQTGPEKK